MSDAELIKFLENRVNELSDAHNEAEDKIRTLNIENDDLCRDLERANDKLDAAKNHFDWIVSRCDDAMKEINK